MSPRKVDTAAKAKQLILWFEDIGITDVPLVGGKNASLGEMYRNLTKQGVAIPNGFAITAEAYWTFVTANKLKDKIKRVLKDLVVTDVKALAVAGKKIRELVLKSSFPKELEKAIIDNYKILVKSTNGAVAVRSSATAEDLPEASFAGQQESYLNVRGEKAILKAVKECIASLFTDRASHIVRPKGSTICRLLYRWRCNKW
jgi:pyruvate,water dikinase